MGGWTFQVGLVGQDISFFNIFFSFLVAKMTPEKKKKNFQKNFEKIVAVIFKKFQQNFLWP